MAKQKQEGQTVRGPPGVQNPFGQGKSATARKRRNKRLRETQAAAALAQEMITDNLCDRLTAMRVDHSARESNVDSCRCPWTNTVVAIDRPLFLRTDIQPGEVYDLDFGPRPEVVVMRDMPTQVDTAELSGLCFLAETLNAVHI